MAILGPICDRIETLTDEEIIEILETFDDSNKETDLSANKEE